MAAQTAKERQDKYRSQLAQAAKEAGFASWSSMLTALANGSHIVVDKKEYQDMKDISEIAKVRAWSKSYLREKKRLDDLHNLG